MATLTKYMAVTCALALALVACGGGEEDEASSANISQAAGSSASCNSATYPDLLDYNNRKSKNAGDIQCLSQLQAAESWRQSAIANCQAGDATAATTSYSNYKKSIPLVDFSCK